MAAINTVYVTFLEQGAHVVGTDSVYGPSRLVLENEYRRFGVASTWVDSSKPENVAAAMRPSTKMVYVESPANPTMKLTDLAACADIAHAHGALLVVDNTFASPVLQQPLALGADVVVHSLTKYLNGHTDVVGGAIVAGAPALLDRLRKVHCAFGGTMDPHQAWLVLRGVKTLGLRMERAQANALEIARFLEAHPGVAWVLHPGLPSHPQHELDAPADVRAGRRLLVRREGRPRGGQGAHRLREARDARREPRRHRDAHRAPRLDDARGDAEGRSARPPGSPTTSCVSPSAARTCAT